MRAEYVFLWALGATIIIETAVLAAFVKVALKERDITNRRIVAAGVIASFATLPYLWFVLPTFLPSPYYVPVGEAIVALVEACIFAIVLGLRVLPALGASILCNLCSYVTGHSVLTLIARTATSTG